MLQPTPGMDVGQRLERIGGLDCVVQLPGRPQEVQVVCQEARAEIIGVFGGRRTGYVPKWQRQKPPGGYVTSRCGTESRACRPTPTRCLCADPNPGALLAASRRPETKPRHAGTARRYQARRPSRWNISIPRPVLDRPKQGRPWVDANRNDGRSGSSTVMSSRRQRPLSTT